MDTWLAVEVAQVRSGTLVHLVGEVDISTITAFERALRTPVFAPARVIADMAGVTFLSLQGARALREANRRYSQDGIRFTVWRPHPTVTRTLKVGGVGDGISITDGPL